MTFFEKIISFFKSLFSSKKIEVAPPTSNYPLTPLPEVKPDPVFPPAEPTPPAAPKLTLEQIRKTMQEGTVEFYEACYRILEYDKGYENQIKAAAARVIGVGIWPWYERIEKLKGIPACLIAFIHLMECNNNPKGCLHNGQPIVGTNLKTTIVPVGRGPFNKFATLEENWVDAALDAIAIDHMWQQKEWTVGTMLQVAERFNGWGYVTGAGKDEISPYIWACSNINDDYGKYVADGKFDPNAPTNGQVGVATVMKELERQGKIKLKFSTPG